MKSRPVVLLGAGLLLAIGFRGAVGKDEILPAAKEQKAVTKAPVIPNAKPPAKVEAKPTVVAPEKAAEKVTDTPTVAAKPSADEVAIRLTGETFQKAYGAADAKAIAAHFTPDAEYIDEDGTVFHGREAIQEAIGNCFAAHPGAQMEMNIYSIRIVAPGVAVEDGATAVTAADDDAEPIHTHYTAVHVKTDGKWLTASVREQAPKNRRQHRTQIEQLAWLQGDWVDENDETLVMFSCTAIDGGNFLLRQFIIHIAGQEAMRGSQRIGWDPVTGKLKSWTFDSEGGYSDGFWHRDEDRWVLKSHGVTADGQPASSTTIYTLVNEHTMTWQSVDHEIAGVELPDSDVVTIVRRAPAPLTADDALSSKSH